MTFYELFMIYYDFMLFFRKDDDFSYGEYYNLLTFFNAQFIIEGNSSGGCYRLKKAVGERRSITVKAATFVFFQKSPP